MTLGGLRRGSLVCLADRAAQAFAGGGEVVLEFADLPLGVAGFGGAGVTLGGELAGGGFEVSDAGDQLGPVGSFDFGAELEAEPAAELVVFGATRRISFRAMARSVRRLDWVAGGPQRGGATGPGPG